MTARRRRAVLRTALLTALLPALLAACSADAPAPPPPHLAATGLDGVVHHPLAVPAGRVHVLVFTSHECPIANAYAPTLRELAGTWRSLPVDLFFVHVDPDLAVAAAREHAAAFELPGTVLLDPRQGSARSLGVTRTPEVVVLTARGRVYRGRIDDQWAGLGSRRPASTHELADAVRSALAGERVPEPHPAAVGCLLPEPRH